MSLTKKISEITFQDCEGLSLPPVVGGARYTFIEDKWCLEEWKERYFQHHEDAEITLIKGERITKCAVIHSEAFHNKVSGQHAQNSKAMASLENKVREAI